jgi:hypothetical protein
VRFMNSGPRHIERGAERHCLRGARTDSAERLPRDNWSCADRQHDCRTPTEPIECHRSRGHEWPAEFDWTMLPEMLRRARAQCRLFATSIRIRSRRTTTRQGSSNWKPLATS